MAVKFRSGGGGGGGSQEPDLVAPDEYDLADAPDIRLRIPEPQALTHDDSLSAIHLHLPETTGYADSLDSAVAPRMPDSVGMDEDAVEAHFANTVASQDSWVDAGSTGTNHGTDTLLNTSSGIIFVQDEARALFAWDFTSMDEWAEIPGDTALSFTAYYETPLVETPFDMGMFVLTSASQPWTEGGVTWSNNPTHPDQAATLSFPLLAGNGERTVVLDTGVITVGDVLGNWLSIETRMVGLLELGVFAVRSREHAGPRPRLALNARLTL